VNETEIPVQDAGAGTEEAAPEKEPLNPECFVCGDQNPNGMHLAFQDGDRRAFARWATDGAWQSYKGIVHGGIISSVLDEAMSKAIISSGTEAFTAELRIRFRKKVCVGDVVLVNGWVVSAEKRRILAEASLTSEDAEERAHAWGVFLVERH
jgi:acyl-coenzyme A thioesterase PaaI-like protein